MDKIKRLGYVAITVPDVDRVSRFYEEVVGLEISERIDDVVYLRCNSDHRCLAIFPGKSRGLHHLGLEVFDKPALEAVRAQLSSLGVKVEPRTWSDPGTGDAVCVRDPNGNLIEVYEGIKKLDKPLQAREVRPLKFGHLTLMTPQMKESVDFYSTVLGFRVSDTVEGDLATWLRCDHDHHGIALLGAPEAKVNHYAFDLEDWQALKHYCDHLVRHNVPVIYGPGRHGPGNNLFVYIPDPAGNIVELTSELLQIWDEESYQPQDWPNVPRSVDVWRALMPPTHFFQGEGRDFHDWSAGSPVIGAGWNVMQAGDFTAIDPSAQITPPSEQLPELKIDISRFTLTRNDPLDHAKALILTDRKFPAGDGFRVGVEMAVEVHGTQENPFGADSDDPRLGSAALVLIDEGTGLVLNFEVSNQRIMALRERFAISAPNPDGAVQPLADPSLTDLQIEPGSWHHYELRYLPGDDELLCPGPDRAEWLVDGKVVHQVDWVTTLQPPRAPVVKPFRFRIGLGIFTLLDDLPDGQGGTIAGLDPGYEQTVFGQGVTARWRDLQFGTGVF
jgi:catechol-2,3-dioxygenase